MPFKTIMKSSFILKDTSNKINYFILRSMEHKYDSKSQFYPNAEKYSPEIQQLCLRIYFFPKLPLGPSTLKGRKLSESRNRT